jgi:hypothetical protein
MLNHSNLELKKVIGVDENLLKLSGSLMELLPSSHCNGNCFRTPQPSKRILSCDDCNRVWYIKIALISSLIYKGYIFL